MKEYRAPRHVIQFISDIEETYGRYPTKIKIGVIEVIKGGGNWPSKEWLDRLYDAVTDTFSPKWGKVPSKIEIRTAMQEMAPPEFTGERIPASEATQITDDAGSVPLDVAMEYVADLLAAFKAGEIRPDTVEPDGRPTAYEYEQAWKIRQGIA